MSRKISIVDYGLGNLFSVSHAISEAGFNPVFVKEPNDILNSEHLVLPGVGSFHRGVFELKSRDLFSPLKEAVHSGKPILGICLGMQLLFEASEESPGEKGFAFIPGNVVRIAPESASIKVPHIGWSRLQMNNSHSTLSEVENQYAYFVHSYHPKTSPEVCLASTNYQDIAITALVKQDNIIGCQFHPEKSGKFGTELLKKLLTL